MQGLGGLSRQLLELVAWGNLFEPPDFGAAVGAAGRGLPCAGHIRFRQGQARRPFDGLRNVALHDRIDYYMTTPSVLVLVLSALHWASPGEERTVI